MQEVLKAAGDVGARLAADSLWHSRIISAYTDAGHPVELITDIQRLALRDIGQALWGAPIRFPEKKPL